MRSELNQIERIDMFLNGTMTNADKIIFERELAVNPELKEAVETQSLLITAVNRKALLAQVQTFAAPPRSAGGSSSILSKFKWPIILSSIVIGSLLTWFALTSDSNHSEKNAQAATTNLKESSENQRVSAFVNLKDKEDDVSADKTENPARKTKISISKEKKIGGLITWISPEVQEIEINPNKDELVECADGSLILIPKNAFVNAKGELVTEPITLEVVEALTLDKMLGYNLSTMSNGKALQSDGMIYIQPKLNGENLLLAEGKSMHIEIPTDNYNPEMMAWKGVPDGKGNLNWENPQQIENYLIPVDLAALDFLPNGFREEVQSTLPYRNHTKSSEKLEDSLYYAVGSENRLGSKWETATFSSTNNQVESIPVGIFPMGKLNSKQTKTLFKFENLPDGNFVVVLEQGDFKSEGLIEDNKAMLKHFVGPAKVTVYSDRCKIVYESLELQTDTQYTLDCINIECEERSKKKSANNANKSTPIKSGETCEACYINPSSIFAINQTKFENTFIATREFNDRLQALHRIENAQTYFDLYVTQLGRNLHEIDAQVAKLLDGKEKSQFEAFAAEKLTNVKPSGQNYDLLREYYQSALQKQQQETASLQKEYSAKSKAELAEIQRHLQKLSSDYSTKRALIGSQGFVSTGSKSTDSQGIASLPRSSKRINSRVRAAPVVGRQSSYKIPWNGVGWVNIDSYLKELGKDDKVVAIKAKTSSSDVKVYQSINTLKTIITLNNTGKGYEAHFPKQQSGLYDNSLALAIARKPNGTFDFAYSEYNPYGISDVSLENWENYSESELKILLKRLNPVGSQVIANIEKESRQIQETLDRIKRAEELKKAREEELAALEKQFQANKAIIEQKQIELLQKQAKERAFLQNLENSINPCHEDYGVSTMTIAPPTGIVEFPDLEAEFPGGQTEMMRWISSNLQYPEAAIEQEVDGKIYVSFIVNSDGSINDASIVLRESKLALLEAEALRLVRTMPTWNPAELSGSQVKTRVRLPIIFTLE